MLRHILTAALVCPAGLPLLAPAAHAASPALPESAARAAWRNAVSALPAPATGCATATYPERAWHAVPCVTAPAIPFIPRNGARTGGQTVGDGNDYAIVTKTPISTATGSFPKVRGLTTETGANGANDYSLQLNTGFMHTAACNKAAQPSKCLSWQQFIYASSYREVFMQYWLINYSKTCPSGWFSYSNDCYTNSSAATAPVIPAAQLKTLSVSGTAVANGRDTVTFMTDTKAYSASGNDSVVDLAGAWTQSEWNIVGDGGGSAATFNSGTSIGVKIVVNDASQAVPVCQAHDGTTGETNNLNLGKCTAKGGAKPSVSFTESN